MVGKQTRVSFKKHLPSKKSKLLELVHLDVYGPLKVKSFSGALYFVTSINDCSRKLWVYALNSEVPNKIWFDKNVKYDHLRVFGCNAFVDVPKDERSKLDAKSRQCIFIGYDENEFGYRLYDPVEKKLVRSRDVKFMEDQTIEDIDKLEKSTPKEDNGVDDLILNQFSRLFRI